MRKVLVISGAGISAESGIPTFRGTDGFWRNFDPAKLATPEAFHRDPELVWEWYRERRAKIREASPNPAHRAVTRLAHHCRDFLLVTQNVDDLHLRADHKGAHLSAEAMVQIHGDIFLTRCSQCDFQYHEREKDGTGVPICVQCQSHMRPGVVWFGETLDMQQIARVEDFLEGGPCDYVLAIGTTALFGYIVDWAVRAAATGGQLIEINPESTTLSSFTTHSLRESAGTALPKLVEDLLSEPR